MSDAPPRGATDSPAAPAAHGAGAATHPALQEGVRRDDSSRHRPGTLREAQKELHRTREEIRDTLDALKNRVRETGEDARDMLNVFARVRDRVRRDPLLLVGAAAGAGLLFGLLTGGRRRPPEGVLTEDEIDEIRAWRAERRRYLRRLERIMEDSVRGGRPPLRERLRERMRRTPDDDEEDE